MGLKVGSEWCHRCRHLRDSYPLVCRKCLECEDTSGSPTNYDPQVTMLTTVAHQDGTKYYGFDTTTHESWTSVYVIGTDGKGGIECKRKTNTGSMVSEHGSEP